MSFLVTLAKWKYQLHDSVPIKYKQIGWTGKIQISESPPHKIPHKENTVCAWNNIPARGSF